MKGIGEEAVTALTARGPVPDRRLVIVGLGRSGSTLLATSLDSHPDIRCENELLGERRLAPLRFLDNRARLVGGRLHGFHLKHWHLPRRQNISDTAGFLRKLEDRGAIFLHLRRENVVAQAISVLYAKASGRWHHTAQTRDRVERLHIDIDQLIATLKERLAWREDEARALEGIERHEIVYERDLREPSAREASLQRIQDVLGISHQPLTSPLEKAVNRPLRSLIANFGEVAEGVGRAGYGCWLAEE